MKTVQDKIELLCRHYSQQRVADMLTEEAGRPVPRSTIAAYLSGRNREIRIIAVRKALDVLYDQHRDLES